MAAHTKLKEKKVALIGSGFIGRSWCMQFACAGYRVSIYDVDPVQLSQALEDIRGQLETLQAEGLPRGTLSVDEQFKRISPASSLSECVQGAFYVHESVPERLELKQKVWGELDEFVSRDMILASSTSGLLPSVISEKMKNKSRFLVVHPTNPPFYCPLVELIKAPYTDDDVIPTAKALMEEIGQVPIVLSREIIAFGLNRIQHVIGAEGRRLVDDGVVNVESLEKVFTRGLGRLYAFNGPFKTAYLNADGFRSFCERYSETILHVQEDRIVPKQTIPNQQIHDELVELVGPVSELPAIRKHRDRCLLSLAKLKRDMNALEK